MMPPMAPGARAVLFDVLLSPAVEEDVVVGEDVWVGGDSEDEAVDAVTQEKFDE